MMTETTERLHRIAENPAPGEASRLKIETQSFIQIL